jgi:hypothetical protein
MAEFPYSDVYVDAYGSTGVAHDLAGSTSIPATGVADADTVVLFDAALTDQSPAPNAFTLVGAPSVASDVFASGAIDLDGLSHIQSDDPILDIGTDDFTIEGWVYLEGTLGSERGWFNASPLGPGPRTSYAGAMLSAVQGAGKWYHFYNGGSWFVVGTATRFAPTHIAIYRTSGVSYFAVNGVVVDSKADTFDYQPSWLTIGGYYSNAYRWIGQIAGFRVSSIARYPPSGFTAPSLPLVAPAPVSVFGALDVAPPGVAHDLAGSTAGTGTASGALSVAEAHHDLAGTTGGLVTATGSLVVTHTLAGQTAGSTTSTGSLVVTRPLAATTPGTSTVSGSLTLTEAHHDLAGETAGNSSVTGALTVAQTLAGTAAGTSSTTGGPLAGLQFLAATTAGTSSATAGLTVKLPLASTPQGHSGVSAAIRVDRALTGQTGGLSSFHVAALPVDYLLAALAAGASNLAAADLAVLAPQIPAFSFPAAVPAATSASTSTTRAVSLVSAAASATSSAQRADSAAWSSPSATSPN